MGSVVSRITGFWGGLTGPAKRLIIAAIVIFVVGVFLLMRFTGHTSYATLASSLEPGDASAITTELDSIGIPYRLTDGGQTIQVPEGSLDQARLDLSGTNVLEGGGVGFEIFDKSNLGATDFTNRVNLVRAMEGELSRTISRLEPVNSATVKIAMPEEELFTSEQDPTTASVVLRMKTGAELTPDQVRGVSRLVANAVPGLEPDAITITDSRGNILEAADESASGAGAAAQRLELERKYEQSVQSRVDGMIAAVLGPGKAVTQVDVQLDLDKVTTDEETYNPESSTPLQSETTDERLESEGGGGGAAAGAATNTPGGATYPAAAAGDGNTEYRKRTRNQTNGVDRVRNQIQRAEGAVTRQSIAVNVSDEVPADVVASLEESVAAAVGFQEDRDRLTVVRVPFAEDGTAKLDAAGETAGAADAGEGDGGGWSQADMLKTGAAAAGVLFLTLFSWLSLRRRQSDLEQALPELLKAGPVPVAELDPPEPTEPMQRLEGQNRTGIEAQIEDLAMRRPEDVAQLIRGWLVEKR